MLGRDDGWLAAGHTSAAAATALLTSGSEVFTLEEVVVTTFSAGVSRLWPAALLSAQTGSAAHGVGAGSPAGVAAADWRR